MSRVTIFGLGFIMSAALAGCVEPVGQNGKPARNAELAGVDIGARSAPEDRAETTPDSGAKMNSGDTSRSNPTANQEAADSDHAIGPEDVEPIVPEIMPVEPDDPASDHYDGEVEHPTPMVVEAEPEAGEETWETPRTLVQDAVPDESGHISSSFQDSVPETASDTTERRPDESASPVPDQKVALSAGQSTPLDPATRELSPAAGSREAAGSAQMMSAVPPQPVKPVIDDDPGRLVGLDTFDLTRILGNPRFVRRDASAQLWRYRNESCILDLFLYRNDGNPQFFVDHVEARGSEGGTAQERECFGALLLERMDPDAG